MGMIADPEKWFQFGFPAAFLVLLVVMFSMGFVLVTRLGSKGATAAWDNLFGPKGFATELKDRHLRFLDDIEDQIVLLTKSIGDMQSQQSQFNQRVTESLANLAEKWASMEREGAAGACKAALLQLTEVVSAGHDADPIVKERLNRIRALLE